MTTAHRNDLECLSPSAGIRVAFVIEDELLRLGLKALLPSLPIEVEAFFAIDGPESRRALDECAPQVVVVTGAGGGPTPENDASGSPAPRRLMILDGHHMAEPSALADHPADGYLIRQNLTAATLGRALSQLAAGEMVIPVELGRQLVRQVRTMAPAGHRASLTMRETETLTLLVRGMSNKQIGRRLSISEHGAKRLVSSVLLKLDTTNRTSAVVKAIRTGLVDDTDLNLDLQ
jgi:DNA-binding NarL/FixJ family response regulator